MTKMYCSHCGNTVDLKEIRACKNCDTYMCENCYSDFTGFCSDCKDYTFS